MTLSWPIYLSFLGAAAQWLIPADESRGSRLLAMVTSVGCLIFALAGVLQPVPPSGLVELLNLPWIPSLGIRYHLAADGITFTLVLLTAVASVVGVLFCWNLEHRPREFFSLYFVLLGGCYGVFLSFDLFLLFVFYELAIIPKYFLIAIWGSTHREQAAMRLALYSFVGSAMVLGGLAAAYVVSGSKTFDLQELARFPFSETFQNWAFPTVFVGFAILAGLWPFHSWAPTGHAAAPTAASMLLAGVVMKLGAYGALRVAMVLFPAGALAWRDTFGTLAAVGILYGALVALTQRDFKRVIGYSSVSHMGFVLLGLMTLTTLGISGAVLQMFSHGIIGGLLFAVAGRMVYDRTHTRELAELERLQLDRVMPFAAVTFTLAGFASMGLPGFSGFIAELKIILGAWSYSPTLAVMAGAGVLVGVVYTLRTMQRVFFGVTSGESLIDRFKHRDLSENEHASPISTQERVGAVILITLSLALGLRPSLLLDWILPALQGPLFDGLRHGGGLG